ncbi:MAG: peptidyl-prolyl cis-trans isomerase [Cellvibrionales bacterium]|nr:peptidyl-prolyl cis-trans isomerase [Cellvibrionales bacterium]
MIQLITSLGLIGLALDFENAPKSAENFQQYCADGFYADTVFHRVIDGFMIQGGGMRADMVEKKPTRAPIQNEADNGRKNVRGTLAMARTSDPHSASSQFFINVSDNGFLDHRSKDANGWGYAVFGEVVAGMDVVDAIKAVKTGNRGMHQNVPLEPVRIKECRIVADAKPSPKPKPKSNQETDKKAKKKTD